MARDARLFRCVKSNRVVRFSPGFNSPLDPLMVWARRRPSRAAIEFDLGGTHPGIVRSYCELFRNVLLASRTLAAQAEGWIGIITGQHAATVEAVLAAVAANRPFVLIDVLSRSFRYELDRLSSCSPRAVLLPAMEETSDLLIDRLCEIRRYLGDVPCWSLGYSPLARVNLIDKSHMCGPARPGPYRSQWWDEVTAFVYPADHDPADRAYGYTGRALYAAAMAVGRWLGLTAGKRILSSTCPARWDGLVLAVASILAGGTCILPSHLRGDRFWPHVADRGVELAKLEAAFIEHLLDRPASNESKSALNLKHVVIEAGHLAIRSALDFFERFEIPLISYYGKADSGGYAIALPLELSRREYELALQAGAVGEELDLCNVRLRAAPERADPQGAPGQERLLEIRGPIVSSGYWTGEQMEPWQTPWLTTNDLARTCRVSNRECYIIQGSVQESVTIAGQRVWPRQVQQLLLETFGFLEDCIVVPRTDELDRHELCAVVIFSDNTDRLRRSDLLALMEARLTAGGVDGVNDAARPTHLVALPRNQIPQDDEGRCDRAQLSRLLSDRPSAGGLAAS